MFFICSAGPPTTNSFECSLFDDSHCIATRARLQFNIRHYRSDIFYLVTGITVGRKWDFKWIAFHLAYERLLNLLIPYQALISPKGYVFGFTQRSHICFCMLDALDITEKRFLRRCSSHRQDVCGKARKLISNLPHPVTIWPHQQLHCSDDGTILLMCIRRHPLWTELLVSETRIGLLPTITMAPSKTNSTWNGFQDYLCLHSAKGNNKRPWIDTVF